MDEDLIDMALDEDGNFVTTPDGDAALITGTDVIIQDVAHELMTAKGSIWLHPDYGGNVIRFMQAEDTPLHRKELVQEIMMVIQKHEYIDPESIQASVLEWDQSEKIRLQAVFDIRDPETGATSPATLLLAIDQNGVRVIKG